MFPVTTSIRATILTGCRKGLKVGGDKFEGVISYVWANCPGWDNWNCTTRNMRDAFKIMNREYGFGFRYDAKTDTVWVLGTPADGFPSDAS